MRRPISISEELLFGNFLKWMKVESISAPMVFPSWGGRSGLTGLLACRH